MTVDMGTRVASNLRYAARNAVGTWDRALDLLRVDRTMQERLVTPGTDVCIEGFPRSGNTFLVRVFRHWNPDVVVGHHVHVPAQIARAVRLSVPCLVPLRLPHDAITSLLIATRGLSVGLAIASYTHFHRRIGRFRAHLTVAPFEEVVSEPGQVIARFAERSGRSFTSGSLTDDEEGRILADMRWWNRVDDRQPELLVPAPSARKDARKREVSPLVGRHPWMPSAVAAYRDLLGD